MYYKYVRKDITYTMTLCDECEAVFFPYEEPIGNGATVFLMKKTCSECLRNTRLHPSVDN